MRIYSKKRSKTMILLRIEAVSLRFDVPFSSSACNESRFVPVDLKLAIRELDDGFSGVVYLSLFIVPVFLVYSSYNTRSLGGLEQR